MIIKKLIERRNEIALQVRELNATLTHIDATIKLFQADLTVEKLEKQRGSLAREMLNILRDAQAPLSSRDMAIKMLGVDHPELDLKTKNIGTALLYQQKKGVIKSVKGYGNIRLWTIL